ncbi:MAG TPA: TonB-dependent receptor [Longimicrobiaceae bacterium]|nr:TonB-dependent receptor [Longimicrobiaceae bacterium]
MRSFCLLLVLLVLTPLLLPAQGGAPASVRALAIQGLVVSSADGKPITAARVAVRSAADSSVVSGAVTGADGRFRVAGLAPGRYLVEVSHLGFEPVWLPLDGAARPVAELGRVELRRAVVMLKGLVAQGERSEIVVAPDRTVYGTAEMPAASGGVATDLLEGVPELEVDIDGSVSMRGTAAQIYINGRPPPMEGEALQIFLQQLPADRVERVEVIPNPSAKFEAEGAGGIVNIVLKDDVELGLNGSVFLNGGTRGDVGSGGRVSYQRGRLNLSSGAFLRYSHRESTDYDLRENLVTDPITFLERDGWSKSHRASGSGDASAEWDLTERQTIWAKGRLYRSGSDDRGSTTYTRMDAEQAPTDRYERPEDSDSRSLSGDVSLGWRRVIQPQRNEFSVELRYRGDADDDDGHFEEVPLTPEGEPADAPTTRRNQTAGEDEHRATLRVDESHPWGDGQIDVGYEGELRRTGDDRLLDVYSDASASDPTTSSRSGFEYRRVIHSGYLTLTNRLGDLGVQAGVRAEHVDTRLQVPELDEAFGQHYLSIFPNANLSYDLGGGRQLRLSYSKRIRRPWPDHLNPIDQSSDSLNRRVGNPDLAPQYSHSVSLEASWTGQMGSIRLSPYYRETVDDWARIRTVDTAGVATETWENLASVRAYGTSLTASMRRVGGVSGFVSVSGRREVRNAANLRYDYSGSAMNWSFRGNLSDRLTPSLSAQAMLFYSPARDVAQGRISSRFMTHFALRQKLVDDRASLSLRITDPLDLYRSSFVTRDPTVVQTGRSRYHARSATISLSYSFGGPSRQRGGDDEVRGRRGGERHRR